MTSDLSYTGYVLLNDSLDIILFLAYQREKSDVLPWIRNLVAYLGDLLQGILVTQHWLYSTSCNFVAKQRHKNVRMTSVLFKMADVHARYLKVKLDLIKRWHPKYARKMWIG